MTRVSVVMATYNGVRYINEQIASIVQSLGADDELIVSDDGSTDGTREIVSSWERNDKRIHMYNGPKRGVRANFSYALSLAKGQYIFLSDQDDVWLPHKVDKILSLFNSDSELTCILHDVQVVDENLNVLNGSFFELRGSELGLLRNLVKNSFMGSAMAIRSHLLPYILPIPNDLAMHDWWIGLINERLGKTALLKEPLGLYRRHDSNVSSLDHGSIPKMVSNRAHAVFRLLERCK